MTSTTQHVLMTGAALFIASLIFKGVEKLHRYLRSLPPSNPWRRWLTLELWKG